MKNLVILHLESVSNLIFNMNRECFVNVSDFQKKCLNYKNYYATATSTAMVLNDITYGDLYRDENTHFFGEFIETHKNKLAMADELNKAGYVSLGVHYPSALGNEINPGHMYAKNSDLVNYSNYDRAIGDVKKTIERAGETDSPFMIYFCNEVSHLCYDDNVKFHIKSPTDRWYYGYKTIDKTVGDIISYLEEKNLMNDTTILLYGDHGDDFYCHDYNGGFAHSIEPYSNIVHTPFMIWDSSLEKGDIDDIVCSLDIKTIMYNLIGFEGNKTDNADNYIYDRVRSKREYVFSRNLFAGQEPKKINGFICNVNKAYGITTKLYTMILTEKGLQMFIRRMDPTCNNNVLDFFYMKDDAIKHITDLDDLQVHYKSYMGHGSIGELQRNYRQMRKWMILEMKKLKKETGLDNIINAGALSKINYSKNMFAEFTKIKLQRMKKKVMALKSKR